MKLVKLQKGKTQKRGKVFRFKKIYRSHDID